VPPVILSKPLQVRVQEEEPQLADGTYELVPGPSSERNLGEGTVTIGNDPETGERGGKNGSRTTTPTYGRGSLTLEEFPS
jgi:hypothetical protein